MSHSLNETEDQQPVGLSKAHQQLVESHLKLSQYNPYRYWLVGHPNEQKRLSVFQIKAAEDFSVCACPELGLTASGPDYLTVQQELHRSVLANLGLPVNTRVGITCAPRFDIHGNKMAIPALTPAPSTPQDDAPVTASTPEPAGDHTEAAPDANEPVEEVAEAAAKEIVEEEDDTNLFAGITEQVDDQDATDLNDQDQLGLF